MSAYSLLYMIGFSILLCPIAILIERLLILFGFTRGNTIVMSFVTFIGNFAGQLLGYKIPFFVYEMFVLFVAVVSSNRFDLMSTMKRGRWWWKNEKRQ